MKLGSGNRIYWQGLSEVNDGVAKFISAFIAVPACQMDVEWVLLVASPEISDVVSPAAIALLQVGVSVEFGDLLLKDARPAMKPVDVLRNEMLHDAAFQQLFDCVVGESWASLHSVHSLVLGRPRSILLHGQLLRFLILPLARSSFQNSVGARPVVRDPGCSTNTGTREPNEILRVLDDRCQLIDFRFKFFLAVEFLDFILIWHVRDVCSDSHSEKVDWRFPRCATLDGYHVKN